MREGNGVIVYMGAGGQKGKRFLTPPPPLPLLGRAPM